MTDETDSAEKIPVSAPDPERAAAYIAKRLDPQIAWFEAKSRDAKRKHHGFSTAQITATGMIPVANLLPHGAVSSTVLAAVAGIATGLAALGSHQSHWQRYRATADALQKLRLHHELRVPPFDGADADLQLIEQAEALMSGEKDDWRAVAAKPAGAKAEETKKKKKDDE